MNDGTVQFYGKNEYGAKKCESWTDITQIAARKHYVLGLRADGSVVMAGKMVSPDCHPFVSAEGIHADELGNHLIDNTVLKHFKRIVTMIGIPNTRFHDLRHTYATNALKMGDSIKVVSENLGHSTVAFTLNVYGHVTPQMKQDSADRMQRLIDACN